MFLLCGTWGAKQQWLLSYLIQIYFEPFLLADEIHTHNHHPINLRVDREYGYKFCIENTPVVFSHHLPSYKDLDSFKKENQYLQKINKKLKRRINFYKLTTIIIVITFITLTGIITYIN